MSALAANSVVGAALAALTVVAAAGDGRAGSSDDARDNARVPAARENAIVIRLRPERLDYFVRAPRERTVVIRCDARNAPPKARIMFLDPLEAGDHRYEIQILHGRGDRTFTVATPVRPGRSRFDVNITGAGRFDFGFWSPGADGREYRFTMQAPVRGSRLDLDLR